MTYLSLLLGFVLKHLGFMIFLSVTIFPFIRHNSCSCLSLTVASSRFPPSNILLTHDCGTLSPVLPINPHHRHLGPPSRLSLPLSLAHTTCTPNSPSLGHFSIECPSIYHRSRGPLLLLYRQTDSEGGTVQIINLTTSSDFTLQKMLLQVKVLY